MKKAENIILMTDNSAISDEQSFCVKGTNEESIAVSVSASTQGGYSVCQRITDFFYTVRSEIMLAIGELRSVVRSIRKWRQQHIRTACCGYSRTVLGWRL